MTGPSSPWHRLPAFLRPAQSAANLAAVRIICCTTALLWSRPDWLVQRATVDAPLVPPTLTGHLLVSLPRHEGIVRAAATLLALFLVGGIVGWRTRWCLAAAAVLSWYVVGLAQSFGKVDHNHHLVWALVILAASPCGDALSLDSRGRRRPGRSSAYGFPVRMIWLVLGLAYLFAGLWKVGGVGLEWAVSDNLRNIMWNERLARGGYEPLVDIAGSPWLYRPAGIFAVLFEVSFIFLIFGRARLIAVAAGLAFHIGTWVTMGIGFLSLLLLYGVFLDWTTTVERYQHAWRRLRQRDAPVKRPTPNSRPRVLVAIGVPTALAVLVAFAGASRELNGWPVASYPDFGYRQSGRQTLVTLESATGRVSVPGLTSIEQRRHLNRARGDDEVWRETEELLQRSGLCETAGPNGLLWIQTQPVEITDAGLRRVGDPARERVFRCTDRAE